MTPDPLGQLSEEQRDRASKGPMPEWIDPMLAQLTHEPFSDENWLYERKLDGERVIAYIEPGGDVRLMSRNQKRVNVNFPEIEEALAERAPAGCILDGEVVSFDQERISDFQRLQPRIQASDREQAKASSITVYYYIFDCLYIDGHDITQCTLRDRKKVLREAIDWGASLRWTRHRNEEGQAYLNQACEKGWEGLIAKQAQSCYQRGRSTDWLKFKCGMKQEFVIGGYTEPQGERIGLGALLLGFYRDSKLVYAGKVGTGFDEPTLRDLRKRLGELERPDSPFDIGEPQDEDVHFVNPKMVCNVAFSEWTQDDKLRHPRFQGLRRDKDAEDVRKEAEQ